MNHELHLQLQSAKISEPPGQPCTNMSVKSIGEIEKETSSIRDEVGTCSQHPKHPQEKKDISDELASLKIVDKTVNIVIEQKFESCHACFEEKETVRLPCGSTLCSSCVDRMIESSFDSGEVPMVSAKNQVVPTEMVTTLFQTNQTADFSKSWS
jgi:hypothetical protein